MTPSCRGENLALRIWDTATGTPIGEPLFPHTESVYAAAVGQIDSRIVLVSGDDEAAQVWDLSTCTTVGTSLTGRAERVSAVLVGQIDGRTVIVSGSFDGTVRIWD